MENPQRKRKPKPTRWEALQKAKEAARAKDEKMIRQGRATKEELRWKNSLIPKEIGTNPEWKKAALAAVLKNMAKKRPSKLKAPKHK